MLFIYTLFFPHEYMVFTDAKISYYQMSDGRKKTEVTMMGSNFTTIKTTLKSIMSIIIIMDLFIYPHPPSVT